MLLSLALMFSDYRYDSLHQARYYLGTVVYPVYYLANLPVKIGDWAYRELSEHRRLVLENEELKENNLLLSSKLQKFAALKSENKRLNELLKSSYDRIGGNAVVAKLIATDYTPFKQRIVLDKGGRSNAYIGQPILGARGVIGQVVEITPFSATGMLISDPGHAMLTQVNRSGLRVLAVGTGNPRQLRIDYVPLDADIREGDTIVTSGLDGRYPADYPVGRISRVTKGSGDNFAAITLKPFAELDSYREVLLVWETTDGQSGRR